QPIHAEIPGAAYVTNGPLEDLSGLHPPDTTYAESLHLRLPSGGAYRIQVNGSSHPSTLIISSVLPGGGVDPQRSIAVPSTAGGSAQSPIPLDPAIFGVPHVSISDASAVEGASGTTDLAFTVTLSRGPAQAVSINYDTADGSATTGDLDYVAAHGTLTFGPG